MPDCLFCKIVNGQIPAAIVYQDERVIAFKDINPQAPMHVLVVPRRHIASLNDLAADDDGLVGEMVRRGAALAARHGHSERGNGALDKGRAPALRRHIAAADPHPRRSARFGNGQLAR
jgi:histidine triad (HIT) family protein